LAILLQSRKSIAPENLRESRFLDAATAAKPSTVDARTSGFFCEMMWSLTSPQHATAAAEITRDPNQKRRALKKKAAKYSGFTKSSTTHSVSMSDQDDWELAGPDDAKAEIRAAVGYLLRGAIGGARGDIVQEIIAIVRQVASGLPPEPPNPLDDGLPGG
jgi:hypothetical protein